MKTNYKEHLYALIMAGGGGTRLWPMSLERCPKQFLKLFGNTSLLEITAERLVRFLPWERIIVSTSSDDYAKEIKKLLPKLDSKNIVVEPIRRDSGPAHALSTMVIYKRDPDAVIINAASDHLVRPTSSYKRVMLAAAATAYQGDYLVAVGVKPTYPHTGMGHLQKGDFVKKVNSRSVYKLKRFVEKPPLEMAKKYTTSGDYFWNANQFVWRADSFLNAVKKHAPEIWTHLEIISHHIGTTNEHKIIESEFPKMPKISVEYSVCEKADNFLMLMSDYQWTDIGDWNEVWKNLGKDYQGNVIIDGDEPGGEIINMDTSDALIHKNGRLIAVIDVDNLVIIDTKDALLICSKSKAQNVKKIVNRLKEMKRNDLL
ncbi:mannose-1-phosphate guanylyltransferase [Candidatus Woesebacteria bacterium]|nr:MAG: mannose-1-phosphate guanylyltransferase [Candidatus Woesebacteria bacterium]